MARFVWDADRHRVTLLPNRLDDDVSEGNPVRVVDVFVDEPDPAARGFDVVPAATGRPGYHPATLLKLYLYGYLNQVASSRRTELEAGRNVELMWLTGRLAPDFKTLADFRRDNGPAIQAVCRQFVVLCRQRRVLAGGVVALDGSRFKAVNARDRNFTPAAVRRRIEQVEASIARNLAALDTADRQEDEAACVRKVRIAERLDALRTRMSSRYNGSVIPSLGADLTFLVHWLQFTGNNQCLYHLLIYVSRSATCRYRRRRSDPADGCRGSSRDLGFTVLEAENATDALRHIEASPDVRLLYTDVHMPGCDRDGFDLAQEVAERRP